MKSQNKQILNILKGGKSITAYDAFLLGCLRLAARIKDLRDMGNNIQDKWMTSNSGKRYKSYYIDKFFDKTTL